MDVHVRMLGPFTVTAANGAKAAGPWPRPTARRLCQLVLASPGRRITRDLACEMLFPGTEPRAAARALSKALSMARAALAALGEPAASMLQADLTHIWATQDAQVDADEQQAALARALAMRSGPEREAALVGALADEGVLLADEPYADWAAVPREHLESLRQEARLALARDRPAGSDAALAAWQAAFEHDPAGEEAVGALLRGYLRQGRRELAVRSYERCAAALAGLGLHTSPSLDELYAAVLDFDEAVSLPAGDVPAGPAGGAPAPEPAPREELRPVTVLFAEVSAHGGSAMPDPEAIREIVGRSLAAVIAEVEAFGGRVTSVSGRGLQALWGAPRAHEDDPERSLRAAYRCLAAVAALPAPAPALRIGVESGPAVVGPIGGGGKVEYGALGDVVAVAASLQSLATPGSALVGPATRAAAGHLFSWAPSQQAADVPGGAGYLGEPLAQPAAAHARLDHLAHSRPAPLVGRKAEVAVLDGAFRAAVEQGRGSVIVLRAEPGLGKTRLIRESRERFLAWSGARSGRLPLWLEGRAASYASATPYGLYQQLLAGWIGASPDQPRPVLRAALERALTALLASTDLLPVMEHIMGVGPPGGHSEIGPEELRRAAFAALRTVISRLVPARRPAVIVLEDLHWADPTSLRFTRDLLALAAGRPLLILATTRPDAGPEVEALVRDRAVRAVTLRPLPDADARDLATALIVSASTDSAHTGSAHTGSAHTGGASTRASVGQPSAEILDAVLAAVDGNPLFLEERLAALLETGALTRDPEGWWLAEAPGSTIPQVLDRLVRSRIDRLGPGAQEIVRVASVLGPEFPAALVARMLPGPHDASGLRDLRASGILQRVPGAREEAYRFRHALIQEAAYYGMLRADRRRLHGLAATAIEATHAGCPEHAAIVGRHLAAAGDRPAQAIRYLELAADHATDGFANDEAIASFTEALTVATAEGDPDAGARLQAKLANVLWRTAQLVETRAAFTEALRLARLLPQPDPVRTAHLYTRLGRLELADRRLGPAADALDAAAALLGGAGMGDAEAGVGGDPETDQWLELMIDGRASYLLWRDDVDAAAALLERVRPVVEARGNPSRRYAFYLYLAMERVNRARLRADDEAVANMRRALAAARESRDTKDTGYATYFLGWVLALHGDREEARRQFTRSLEIADRVGESLLRANSLGNLMMLALNSHDCDTVRDLAPRAIAAARALSHHHVSWAIAPLAWLAWQEGRPDDVVRIAAEVDAARDTPTDGGNHYRWAYLFPLAAVYLARSDPGRAVAAIRPLLDPGQQALPDQLATEVEAACRTWDGGQRQEAAASLQAALGIARDLGFF
jgi:DNA-binding SARP family transcriptional activator/class 3 adenylate cyclase